MYARNRRRISSLRHVHVPSHGQVSFARPNVCPQRACARLFPGSRGNCRAFGKRTSSHCRSICPRCLYEDGSSSHARVSRAPPCTTLTAQQRVLGASESRGGGRGGDTPRVDPDVPHGFRATVERYLCQINSFALYGSRRKLSRRPDSSGAKVAQCVEPNAVKRKSGWSRGIKTIAENETLYAGKLGSPRARRRIPVVGRSDVRDRRCQLSSCEDCYPHP